MDIYDYLKMDHEKVVHLFKLYEKATLPQRKIEILTYLTKELMVHAHAEQETFYKALLQHPASKEEIKHGEKEHHEIEEQIKIVNESSGQSKDDEVLKLKNMVEHHVHEEEGEIFKLAKKVLRENDALVLKEKMHSLKGKFLLWLDKKENESPSKVV